MFHLYQDHLSGRKELKVDGRLIAFVKRMVIDTGGEYVFTAGGTACVVKIIPLDAGFGYSCQAAGMDIQKYNEEFAQRSKTWQASVRDKPAEMILVFEPTFYVIYNGAPVAVESSFVENGSLHSFSCDGVPCEIKVEKSNPNARGHIHIEYKLFIGGQPQPG